jgi:hypothetical protein
MTYSPFKREQLMTVSEALDIAEDRIGAHYKFSSGQWKRHRYDVKTLSGLRRSEIVPEAFALLYKGVKRPSQFEPEARNRDDYLICIQDHEILKALRRDEDMGLLPLLVYVFAHELVHIVRFSNFLQRFEVSEKDRELEEKVVHSTTHRILRRLSLPRLDYVLRSYEHHGFCDLVLSQPIEEM